MADAAIPQKIFAETTQQVRPDGQGGKIYYHHMIFGMALVGGVRQSLKKDRKYMWVATQADGRIISKEPATLVSDDNLTVGRQVFLTNPTPEQVTIWELWEMPEA